LRRSAGASRLPVRWPLIRINAFSKFCRTDFSTDGIFAALHCNPLANKAMKANIIGRYRTTRRVAAVNKKQ
jgi:hypothetical protein